MNKNQKKMRKKFHQNRTNNKFLYILLIFVILTIFTDINSYSQIKYKNFTINFECQIDKNCLLYKFLLFVIKVENKSDTAQIFICDSLYIKEQGKRIYSISYDDVFKKEISKKATQPGYVIFKYDKKIEPPEIYYKDSLSSVNINEIRDIDSIYKSDYKKFISYVYEYYRYADNYDVATKILKDEDYEKYGLKTYEMEEIIGDYYDKKNDIDSALSYYKKSKDMGNKELEQKLKKFESLYNKELKSFYDSDEYDKCIEYFNKSYNIDTTYKTEKSKYIYMYLYALYMKSKEKGDFSDFNDVIMNFFNKVITDSKSDYKFKMRYLRGTVYFYKNEKDNAKKDYQLIVNDPDCPEEIRKNASESLEILEKK